LKEVLVMTSQERQQFWQRHIGAWQATDLSGAAFCKQHDLNYAQFNYWRKKLLATASDSKLAGFARVTQLATGSVQDGLALHLPSGMRLSGITVDNLDVAVAILRHL
jgi:hypothetical protein